MCASIAGWFTSQHPLVVLLNGQGQHHLPLPDLAGRAARLRRRGVARRRTAHLRRAQPAHRGRQQRVPHDGGPQVLLVEEGRHLRARPAGPLPARRLSLLRRGGRPGEPGQRLHLGGVRASHQRRTRRRLGRPRQPRRDAHRQETSGRSRPPGRCRKATSPCSHASRRRSRRRATSSAATGRRPPSARQ